MRSELADEHRKTLAWVLGVLAVAYLPIFFGQIVFFRDPAHWNYPARFFLRASVLRGEWPWWNPEEGLGFAVLGNPLYGLFYPPNWLFLVTPPQWIASVLTWQAFAHLLWGSAGMVLLAGRLGLRGLAAGVAGLAWGLSGFTTSAWSSGILLFSGAWLPWVALGFLSPCERRGRAVAAAALPLGMALLCGEIFAAAMSAMFGVGLALLQGRRRWGVMAAATALGGAVGAVVLLPARAIAAATARGQPLSRALAEACSLHPLRLLEMVAPGALGWPQGDYPAGPIVGEPQLDGVPLMFSVYLGGAVVALALLALGRRRNVGLGLGAVFALLVALGRHAPVHRVLRLVVFPLSYMRYPEKYLVWLVALVALLAGAGAMRLLDERGGPWKRTAALAGLLILLAVLAPFPPAWVPFVRWGAVKGAGGVLLVLAVQGLMRRGSWPRLAPALLVAGVAADLAVAAWPYLTFAPRELAVNAPPAARAITADHRGLGPPRLYRADHVTVTLRQHAPPATPVEDELHLQLTLIPNSSTTFGVAALPGYDAAIPVTLPELWIRGQKRGQSVLRLLGIEYALLPIEHPEDPVERRRGLEPMLSPLPGARLYRVPGALPRVYLAGQGQVLDDAAALDQLFDDQVVTGRRALLAPGSPSLEGGAGDCRLTAFAGTRLRARCRVQSPALAVFVEQYDPGWTARVDGSPAPLYRANLLMRAVPVAPGEHEVELSYTPPALRAGLGASIAAALLIAVLAAIPSRRRRETHSAA